MPSPFFTSPLLAATALACASTAAWANCPPGQEPFLTCQIGPKAKSLMVCFDDDTATYSFGPAKAPELTLSESVATIAYTPWPGVGRAIWEEVTFHNGAYSYTVNAGFERTFSEDPEADAQPTPFGGVSVARDGVVLADLSCSAGTIDAPWGGGLYAAKQALGLRWDDSTQSWQPQE